MNYIGTYEYTEIHAIELEIPKYCIRFLFILFIVRKIDISCELVVFLNKYTLLLSNFIGPFL
ncbi:hypothetical protein CON01_22260 [Bacillus thuringiensis]|uniref:Uncharacterized protein n=1 Tax=Bacillus thuringiensis TaxID=1428 RepID=A0A9X6TX62_BACTU|nr:hypothetical protein CON01_22260 [Bacillus thuringiensis]PEF86372.1 hypothetical protein CON51_16390 [Bacillus thuringiensis]PES46206.1 hypothetical protein CN506_31780 [Bacillus thuringiensis]PGH76921.1 hypothetical protein CN896_27830 [Bacillus thuringiensis]PGL95476.1 hypothetical protein CN943_15115 [Bacillus thuringiensis]